jgi:aminoglycoside phosphotransferase (APT) family kinase protein
VSSHRAPVADPVDDILAHHGIREPWQTLPRTGVANRIYGTSDVVLRVATDHPEAVEDARTESVAAPAVREAGVLAPRLIAFDDSRTLVDRPYSIWERIHGETLGLLSAEPPRDRRAWTAVGRELARLHLRVTECADPRGWLDRPDRDTDLRERVGVLVSNGRIDRTMAGALERWIATLAPDVAASTTRRFLHNDVAPMNVMCAADGALLALIDWGDAGWGDPVLELAQVPCAATPWVLDGYQSEAATLLGDYPEVRIIWDKLAYALDALADGDRLLLDELWELVSSADARWRLVDAI